MSAPLDVKPAGSAPATAQDQASQYARSLIEASLDPLVTISPEGKITDVDEATVKVTGVPRGRLIGSDFCDYYTAPGKAREGYQRVFAECFSIPLHAAGLSAGQAGNQQPGFQKGDETPSDQPVCRPAWGAASSRS